MSEGGGRDGGRTSLQLVPGMGMFVSLAPDLMANEALIVTHMLHSLSRGQLDGVHVHGIRVTTGGGGG